MSKCSIGALCALGIIAFVSSASADDKEVSINGSNRTVTHACTADAPKRVTISGNQHTITITGACDDVIVSGMRHTVTIESAAAITVSGMENKVMYKSGIGKKKPKITTSGMKNSVVKIPGK
jgi:hypothetical protein